MQYYNYVYEPTKLIASKPQITPSAFKQTYILEVDGIEYVVTCLIQKKQMFVAFRTDFGNPDFSTTLHEDEEHVYKMFSALNDIFNRYVKTSVNVRTMGDFNVESIELSPALYIANYAIALGERNKLYEEMMRCYIFNGSVEFEIDYKGNNLIFKDLVKLDTKKKLKFSEI